jgi:hypothetical protein
MATDTIVPAELATSIDLSHHLNAHSKARHPSPLKEIIKFMGYEGMVSLAGGMNSIHNILQFHFHSRKVSK